MNKKAVIIGASTIVNHNVLSNYLDSFIIACDKGYEECLKENIEPDILIGDFDTLDTSLIKNPKSTIKLNPIKDDTDTFFAVKYLLEKGFNEIHFFGCLGNKIDHTIGNIQILSYLKDNNVNGYLHSEDDSQIIFMLKNESFSFKKNLKGMVSIFSFTNISKNVTIKNMKYNIENYKLSSSIPLGVSNEIILDSKDNGYVSVEEGKLLVIGPKDSIL